MQVIEKRWAMSRMTDALAGAERRTGIAALLVTLSATLWIYAPLRGFGFISYDDPTYVLENARVRAGLDFHALRWAATTYYFANWHPVTWLSYMLDADLWALDPGAMHAVDLALHLANVCLVYGVLRQLRAPALGAAFVAALFALHPLNVESVAWISQRKGLLSTAFGLLSISLYLRWSRAGSGAAYAACAGCLALGLAAKPMLVTWPVLLLLVDSAEGRLRARSPASEWRARITEKLPLAALSAVASALSVAAQYHGEALIAVQELPLAPRIENAVVATASYLKLAAWPRGLAPIYPHPLDGIPLQVVLAAALLLVGVTACLFGPLRRHRIPRLGWIWYLVSLLPVIGIVQVGSQAMADRYTYVPLLGIWIAIAYLGGRVIARWPRARPLLLAAGVAALLALAVTTRQQVMQWRSSRALFEHTLAVTPPNYVARVHLGSALLAEGDAPHALDQYLEAEAIAGDLPMTRIGLAGALIALGRTHEALALLQSRLAEHPDWAEGYVTLGNLRLAQRDFEAARMAFARAIALAPQLAPAHNGLGAALAGAGDPRAAIPSFERALELAPDLSDAQRNLATAKRAAGSAP
jgi:Flp pilus assembly protein TadD